MKLICIGRNYTAHIEELANEKPQDPVVFIKPDSAVLPKQQDFYIPEFSNDVHHEVEILVKIKKVGKHINAKFAHKYYDEIGLGIDFTARDKDLNAINFSLLKNKNVVQQGNTALMLWKIDELIAYVSQYFMLKKGDILFTGTPAGVGKVLPNDYLEGFIEEKRIFAITVK